MVSSVFWGKVENTVKNSVDSSVGIRDHWTLEKIHALPFFRLCYCTEMPISTFTRRVRTAYETIRELWLRALIFVTRPIVLRLLPDPYTEAGNVRVASKPTHASRVTMTEIIAAHHCNVKVAKENTVLISGVRWLTRYICKGSSQRRNHPGMDRYCCRYLS